MNTSKIKAYSLKVKHIHRDKNLGTYIYYTEVGISDGLKVINICLLWT